MNSHAFGAAWSWIGHDRVHTGTAIVAALIVAVAVARLTRAARTARSLAAERRAATDDSLPGIDPFTAYVAAIGTALSVNGMWHVFSETIVLPAFVRLVACTVLESMGFAFMRKARRNIVAKKRATREVAAVWGCAGMSGSLSAAASASPLEAVIRLVMPLLSVLLLHSWMLPEHDEVTLTAYEKGKRAWRFVRAHRRLERAGNKWTRRLAGSLVNRENDRLTKRSLMTGNATAVLAAAERGATAEAMRGLGADPDRTEIDSDPAAGSTPTESTPTGPGIDTDPSAGSTPTPDVESTSIRRSRSTSTAGGKRKTGSTPIRQRDPAGLMAEAAEVELWRGNRSAERIRTALHIAPKTARQLAAELTARDRATDAQPVEHINGHDLAEIAA